MGLTTFGVVSAGALTSTWDPTSTLEMSQGEVGTISVVKRGAEFSIVKVVKMHVTTRCSVGEVLMHSTVSAAGGVATTAITAQEGQPLLGIAAASITSGRAGYAFIGGLASAAISQISTVGDFLTVSGSTAAQVTNETASGFGLTTLPLTSSFMLFARQMNGGAASNISVGSLVTIRFIGIWG